MGHLLAVLVPLALASGVSPVLLSEQLLLLTGRGGRAVARAFALGAVTVVLLVMALVLTLGASLSLPQAPRLSAGVDVGLGALLLLLATAVGRRSHLARPGPEQPPAPRRSLGGSRSAYGFGLFSMGTNVTTLPLVVVATKDVSASGAPVVGQAVALLLLLGGACAPVGLPLVLDAVPRGRARLVATGRLLTAHSRQVTVAVLAGAGVLFLVKGLAGL